MGLGNAATLSAAARGVHGRTRDGKRSKEGSVKHRKDTISRGRSSKRDPDVGGRAITWEEAWQALDAITDVINGFVEVKGGYAFRLDIPAAHKDLSARWQPLLHEWWMIANGTVKYPNDILVIYRGNFLTEHIDRAVTETAPLVAALLAEGDQNTGPWLDRFYKGKITEFRERAKREAEEDARKPPVKRPYAEIVKELQGLKMEKEAVLADELPETALPEIQSRIEAVGVELRGMGVRLETIEIMDRLETDPSINLLQVTGQIIQIPPGDAYMGQKLAFQAVLDYVPPGRLVEYAWRWRPSGSQRENEFYTFDRSSADQVDLGSGFWSGVQYVVETGGMEVIVYVYLGREEKATQRFSTGIIKFTSPHPETYKLKASQTVAMSGAPITFELADWAPTLHEYWIDWDIDDKLVANDVMVLNTSITKIGNHTITAHVHRRGATWLRSRGERVAYPGVSINVQDPEQVAARMLSLMIGPEAPPATKQLEAILERSITEVEHHIAEGGEQKDFWGKRLEALRKQLARLREEIPDPSFAQELPNDPAVVKTGFVYTGPVKAVLILPGGGSPQVLNIYLRAWKEDSTWRARLVDLTGADVYARNGDGPTPLAAYENAFREWMDSHPYPRGGKVRYEFAFRGWSLPTTFNCRDTKWETVKAWVDGILAVGGIVVGALLLLTPEPTGATKALGYLFITASAVRSVVAIHENLQLGIDPLDIRNVVEGLSIITSVLGVGGSLMRQYGIRTVSPLVYRAANWTIMASVAGDLGTMALVSHEALAQLRAVQADPTKGDPEKNAAWLRVAAQLFASGAMFIVTNKDLIKQGIRPSDFVRLDPRLAGSTSKPLSGGSRLDLAVELKKVGDVYSAERVSTGKISDLELLDRHALLPWLRSGAPADVEAVSRRLSPEALAAVQDVPVRDVRTALEHIGDDVAVNAVAATLKGAGLVGVAPTVGKVRKLSPDTKIRILADGQIELDGQITLGSPKLATLGDDKAIQSFLKALRALRESGSPEALKRKDPAAAHIIDTLGKQRWRFEHHMEQAGMFLADMGLDQEPLFRKMSDYERVRLYDMHVEDIPYVSGKDIAAKTKTKKLFSEYSMAQRPRSVTEFVAHFQYGRARFARRVDELAADFSHAVTKLTSGSPPMSRSAAEKHVRAVMAIGGPAQPRTFAEKALAELGEPKWILATGTEEAKAITQVVHHVGGATVTLGTDKEVEAGLRATGAIPMADAATAAYHVEKHHDELPPAQHFNPGGTNPPGLNSPADAYFKAAENIVRDPASKVTSSWSQDGRSKIYTFVRESAPGGTVIVLVTSDGKAIMLTFMPKKSSPKKP